MDQVKIVEENYLKTVFHEFYLVHSSILCPILELEFGDDPLKMHIDFYHQKQPPEVFCKRKYFHRNFAKFTGKHLYQSLFFNKVAGLTPATLLKKRLWQECFL